MITLHHIHIVNGVAVGAFLTILVSMIVAVSAATLLAGESNADA